MTGRSLGLVVNILLRLSIFYFLLEPLLDPGDPRFAGKGLGPRNLIVVFVVTLLFPALHRLWKKKPWKDYPVWIDNLYLSVFWLDMAGNSFGLYNAFRKFNLIPHFHGPGALALVVRYGFRRLPLEAMGVVGIIHILHEGQEFYGDIKGGTHNVAGPDDIVNDLLAGVLGGAVYLGVAALIRRARGAPPVASEPAGPAEAAGRGR